jgi:hypothetical protein
MSTHMHPHNHKKFKLTPFAHTTIVLMMLEQWNEWKSKNEMNKDGTIK